ncbi:hypothetical protein EGW08_020554 [Elysia chlorotica]|uniref:BAG family molecular chaperone regulator 1 n=1 Tax=Elysia chlorotica TaxID=188477 RepID=A0A433SRB3_ELYCH|nr:hypothetical protein EGW08_020554 [Elysia chlorotica]
MAATRSRSKRGETMELVLVLGQKRLPMLVSVDGSDRPGDCVTVGHLSDAVTEVCQVRADCQKLIHRGRTLFRNDRASMEASFGTSLASLGIKNGDKIMLLVRKTSEKQEENHTEEKSPLTAGKSQAPDRLAELQSQLNQISGQLDQQVAKARGLQNLPDLKTLRLTLRGFHEQTMRLLETVDSTIAPENSGADFRTQRKALVNAIQCQLDQCEGCMSDVTSKIQSLEQQQDQSGTR